MTTLIKTTLSMTIISAVLAAAAVAATASCANPHPSVAPGAASSASTVVAAFVASDSAPTQLDMLLRHAVPGGPVPVLRIRPARTV